MEFMGFRGFQDDRTDRTVLLAKFQPIWWYMVSESFDRICLRLWNHQTVRHMGGSPAILAVVGCDMGLLGFPNGRWSMGMWSMLRIC